MDKLTGIISSVMPAFFSATQTELGNLRRYLCRLSQAIALVTFPLAMGIVLVAESFVPLVLGAKWSSAILPLQLLSAYAAIYCLAPLQVHVLNVTGDSRFGMSLSIVNLLAYPPMFYFCSRWGPSGIAAGWMILYPILSIVLFRRGLRNAELSFREYFQALRPAAESTLIMAAGVLTLKFLEPGTWPPILRLTSQVCTGVVLYLSAITFLYSSTVKMFVRQLRLARKSPA
jgi:O-antigen/teichoic acid export membrane protein